MSALDENYKNLAMAVVKLACRDYLKALRKLRKHPGDEKTIRELESNERFFRSDWFDILCDLDGEGLMKALQEKERREYAAKK